MSEYWAMAEALGWKEITHTHIVMENTRTGECSTEYPSDEAMHQSALKRVAELMEVNPLTPELSGELDRLVGAVVQFETKHYGIV